MKCKETENILTKTDYSDKGTSRESVLDQEFGN